MLPVLSSRNFASAKHPGPRAQSQTSNASFWVPALELTLEAGMTTRKIPG